MPIDMPCVTQKTLPYMPHDRKMTMSSTLKYIYIYIISLEWVKLNNKIKSKNNTTSYIYSGKIM